MAKKSHEEAVREMKSFNEKPENTGGITCKQKIQLEAAREEK